MKSVLALVLILGSAATARAQYTTRAGNGMECRAYGVPTSFPATQSIYYEQRGVTNIASTAQNVVCAVTPNNGGAVVIASASLQLNDESSVEAVACHLEAIAWNGFTMYSSTKRSCFTDGGCGLICPGDYCYWNSADLPAEGWRTVSWSYPFGTSGVSVNQAQFVCSLPHPEYGRSHVINYSVQGSF